jgi:hypothetical protein
MRQILNKYYKMSLVHAVGFTAEIALDLAVFTVSKLYRFGKWMIWGGEQAVENVGVIVLEEIKREQAERTQMLTATIETNKKLLDVVSKQEQILENQTHLLAQFIEEKQHDSTKEHAQIIDKPISLDETKIN